MLCHLCGKEEATVEFKQVIDGAARELSVCAGCAKKNGFTMQSPLSLTDFLFGATFQQNVGGGEGQVCQACGMKLAEFKKNSRLGCAVCYEAFAKDLAPMLETMHRGRQHAGKVPRQHCGIAALQKRLKEAVAAQRFEEAAGIRDEIKLMNSGKVAEGGGRLTSDN